MLTWPQKAGFPNSEDLNFKHFPGGGGALDPLPPSFNPLQGTTKGCSYVELPSQKASSLSKMFNVKTDNLNHYKLRIILLIIILS